MPAPVEVWPVNWQAVCLFSRCGGQWKYAGQFACVTGLDYSLPLKLMDGMSLSKKGYDFMIDSMGVMEMAALSAMHED